MEKDKKKLRQLIYSCDETVKIQHTKDSMDCYLHLGANSATQDPRTKKAKNKYHDLHSFPYSHGKFYKCRQRNQGSRWASCPPTF